MKRTFEWLKTLVVGLNVIRRTAAGNGELQVVAVIFSVFSALFKVYIMSGPRFVFWYRR
jgi:hypothetical protein